MIRFLNHIAIAVPDIQKAIALYSDVLGFEVSNPKDMPDHGVTVAVAKLPNVQIELVAPLGDNSPVAKYLEKHPSGGLHHISFEVDDIKDLKTNLMDANHVPLGDGKPKDGMHDTPTLFYNPKDFLGVLIEFEQKGLESQKPISPVKTNVSRHLSKQQEFREQGAHVKVFMEDWY